MSAGKPREVPAPEPGADGDASASAASAAAGAGADEGLSSLLRRGVKAAIARWAVRRRPTAEIWPRPQDEAMHPWDGRRHFAEDYTLAAVQPGLAIVARIESLPGRDAQRVWLTLLTPTAVYALPGTGQALLRGGTDHWRAAGLAVDCVEPLRQWTIRYSGRLEVRVDLTFVSQVPAFVPGSDDDPDLVSRQFGAAEWDARLLKVIRRHTLRSYVQVGEVHGTVAMGPQLRTIRGAGLRQHSWGVRDWGASDEATQCFASYVASNHVGDHASVVTPARAASPTAEASTRATAHAGETGLPAGQVWVHQARFPWLTLAGGFVQRAAGLVPIRDLGVRPTRVPGRAPSHVGFHIDAPGGDLELEAESVAELALDMDGRGRLELVLCRIGGSGVGWALVIHQRRLLPRPGAPDAVT